MVQHDDGRPRHSQMTNTVPNRVPVHHQKSLRNESCGRAAARGLCVHREAQDRNGAAVEEGNGGRDSREEGGKISDNYGGIFLAVRRTKSGKFREGFDRSGATSVRVGPLSPSGGESCKLRRRKEKTKKRRQLHSDGVSYLKNDWRRSGDHDKSATVK